MTGFKTKVEANELANKLSNGVTYKDRVNSISINLSNI